jgi:hypothetical protein
MKAILFIFSFRFKNQDQEKQNGYKNDESGRDFGHIQNVGMSNRIV